MERAGRREVVELRMNKCMVPALLRMFFATLAAWSRPFHG